MEQKVKPAARKKAAPAAPKVMLQRADWIKAGLRMLATSGPDAVLVAPLAAVLGVTKGSFYWHFSSREELLDELLEEWKRHATQRVIEIIEASGSSAKDKIRKLAFIGTNSSIDEFGGAIELAVRTWARASGKVRKTVAGVDRQRISYLTALYTEIGSAIDPELLACMHYSFSAGLRMNFAFTEAQKLAMREAALDQVFFSGSIE
jgi:AcrR family transcriptional regulator